MDFKGKYITLSYWKNEIVRVIEIKKGEYKAEYSDLEAMDIFKIEQGLKVFWEEYGQEVDINNYVVWIEEYAKDKCYSVGFVSPNTYVLMENINGTIKIPERGDNPELNIYSTSNTHQFLKKYYV